MSPNAVRLLPITQQSPIKSKLWSPRGISLMWDWKSRTDSVNPWGKPYKVA